MRECRTIFLGREEDEKSSVQEAGRPSRGQRTDLEGVVGEVAEKWVLT